MRWAKIVQISVLTNKNGPSSGYKSIDGNREIEI